MSATSKPEPPERGEFSTFLEVPTRWQDVDVYGHVNNVVYFSYFDTAVNRWYIQNAMLEPGRSDGVYLVASNACQFFAEIKFPQTVHVGIALAHLGNSSVRFRIGLFVDNAKIACAVGDYVHIHVDRLTRRPVAIPPGHRAFFDKLNG